MRSIPRCNCCSAIFTSFVMFTNLSPIAPVKLADGTVANYIGVQVDVSRTTEGDCAAFADGAQVQLCTEVSATWFDVRCDNTTTGSGIPLLIKYDSRLRSRADGTVTEVIQASDRKIYPQRYMTCLTHQVCFTQELRKENLLVPPLPPSRAGLDLATTLERIQQSFVISDPMLPDCPIVFASDNFIEFTGYAHTPARSALRRCT